MSSEAIWNEFEKTGRIEDYMKYKEKEDKEAANEVVESKGNSDKRNAI